MSSIWASQSSQASFETGGTAWLKESGNLNCLFALFKAQPLIPEGLEKNRANRRVAFGAGEMLDLGP
jgi:hypothetical protein